MPINAGKRTRLEAAGFTVGTSQDFLGLTSEENALIEMRLALSAAIKQRRQTQHLSQLLLARRLQSNQSHVAKIEAGDPSIPVDLLLRALLVTGATRAEIGEVIATGGDDRSQASAEIRAGS